MKQQNENQTELWDLYDKNRIPTGKTHKRGEPMKEEDYHMVVHVCIFNSKNELLIQQRQPFKEGWPNMWDLTVGGSATSGDTSQSAAEREVFEEIECT
ncbi:MAG: NUDIX domain-containing protein [Lachnospiraceae bacterium]|nr:NUDIX domain-containing protein [Lachnospiraceae bacterium]MCI8824573.1 NUDIX domain-containing protein [Lachnospiraceae bacterium]